jgi:predicted DNA-binding transcriptional regulator YafY
MPRESTERQLARRLAIINLLPLLPDHGPGQGATVDQLMTRLADDFPVDRRTVERDLRDLADLRGPWRLQFGLEVEQRPSVRDGRINEWFTTAHSKIPLFKSVTAIDALVANFARQELGPFLPHAARQALDEQVGTIERKQRHLQLTDAHRQAAAYQDRIRRLPDGRAMAPGKVAPAHLQAVNDALLKNLMLGLVYRAARSEVNKMHRVYPVGLVIHDRTLRLLAVDEAQGNLDASAMTVKSFHLHRMQDVTPGDPVARTIRVPTLDEALAAGALVMWSKGRIRLHLRFAGGEEAEVFARTLEEMPLSDDQTIFLNTTGQRELMATVTNSSTLRRMLQSMAREVKVLGPDDLKHEMRTFLAEALALQQGD